MVLAAVLVNVAFAGLGAVFDYPDVLKEPADEVLASFPAAQAAVTGWFLVLALGAALLAPVAVGVGRLSDSRAMRWAVPVGIAAAVVQVVGLLRWPLLVPGWAATAAGGDPAAAAAGAFETANRVLGNLIGETGGYLLSAAWTGLVLFALGSSFAGRLFVALGAVSAVLILAGVASPLNVPLIDMANFVGYVLWSIWLVIFAVVLVVRQRRSAGSADARTNVSTLVVRTRHEIIDQITTPSQVAQMRLAHGTSVCLADHRRRSRTSLGGRLLPTASCRHVRVLADGEGMGLLQQTPHGGPGGVRVEHADPVLVRVHRVWHHHVQGGHVVLARGREQLPEPSPGQPDVKPEHSRPVEIRRGVVGVGAHERGPGMTSDVRQVAVGIMHEVQVPVGLDGVVPGKLSTMNWRMSSGSTAATVRPDPRILRSPMRPRSQHLLPGRPSKGSPVIVRVRSRLAVARGDLSGKR